MTDKDCKDCTTEDAAAMLRRLKGWGADGINRKLDQCAKILLDPESTKAMKALASDYAEALNEILLQAKADLRRCSEHLRSDQELHRKLAEYEKDNHNLRNLVGRISSLIDCSLTSRVKPAQKEAPVSENSCGVQIPVDWLPEGISSKMYDERVQALTERGGLVWKDPVTGLEWQVVPAMDKMTWGCATVYARNLNLVDGTGWRLPTKDELARVYANDAVLVGPTGLYWTSTQSRDYSGSAWAVAFPSGNCYIYPVFKRMYVRCVRGAVASHQKETHD